MQIHLVLLLHLLAQLAASELVLLNPQNTSQILSSFPISNLFHNPGSLNTSSFAAFISLGTFSSNVACILEPFNVPNTAVSLLLVDWQAASRARCQYQQQVIDQTSSTVLFHGEKDNFYDVAGPYVYPADSDGLATTPDAAAFIRLQLSQINQAYLAANVTRSAGPWNTMWHSMAFSAFHWIMFGVNAMLLLVGLHQLITRLSNRRLLPWNLLLRRDDPYRMTRQSHLLLTLNGVIFLILSLPSFLERTTSVLVTVLTYAYWIHSYWTYSAFHTSWSKVAFRVFKNPHYKALMMFTLFNTVVLTVFCIVMVVLLALQVQVATKVLSTVFLILIPALFVLQGTLFAVFAVQFLTRIMEQRISMNTLRQLQQMTLIGVFIFFGSVLGLIGIVLFLVGVSLVTYYSFLFLMNLSGWVCQAGAFLVDGNIEYHSSDSDELPNSTQGVLSDNSIQDPAEVGDAHHSYVPLSALSADSPIASRVDSKH